MLSGPIERATNMFKQFKNKPVINYEKIVRGFQLILWGYFMKLVIADRIAILLHVIFPHVELHSGVTLLMAVLLYPIQVYADLGGYSLIAIGTANVMGIDVMANFRRPFFSTSMSEFWRRWHISLISWLTDYIYIPISYNLRKYKKRGIVIALMLTFLISGIWHGAAFTFIFWGLIQGALLSIEAVTVKRRTTLIKKYNLNKKNWYILLCCVFTYLLFAFSEIFCGPVDSLSKGFYIIKKIFTGFNGPLYYDDASMLFFLFAGICSLFFVEYKMEHGAQAYFLVNNKNAFVRFLLYAILIIIILLIGVFDGGQFIYFRF